MRILVPFLKAAMIAGSAAGAYKFANIAMNVKDIQARIIKKNVAQQIDQQLAAAEKQIVAIVAEGEQKGRTSLTVAPIQIDWEQAQRKAHEDTYWEQKLERPTRVGLGGGAAFFSACVIHLLSKRRVSDPNEMIAGYDDLPASSL